MSRARLIIEKSDERRSGGWNLLLLAMSRNKFLIYWHDAEQKTPREKKNQPSEDTVTLYPN